MTSCLLLNRATPVASIAERRETALKAVKTAKREQGQSIVAVRSVSKGMGPRYINRSFHLDFC
jgi:hypothetical protein